MCFFFVIYIKNIIIFVSFRVWKEVDSIEFLERENLNRYQKRSYPNKAKQTLPRPDEESLF